MKHSRPLSIWPFIYRVAALGSAAVVLAIFLFLIWFCLPLLDGDVLASLLTWDWQPFHGKFGILPMVTGSFFLSIASVLIAFPVAVGICCFAHGASPSSLAKYVLRFVKLMTSIPTVVYGFIGVFVLVPLLRNMFHSGSGFSFLAATAGLAVLVLPTIVLMLHSQFMIVEKEVKLTTAALGISAEQTLIHFIIPASGKGFIVAAVLGFGRALGDTMIPLMLAGNAPQFPDSLFDSIRTLTAHIALVVAADSQSLAYLSLFACGLILFLSSILVNVGLQYLATTGGERNEA